MRSPPILICSLTASQPSPFVAEARDVAATCVRLRAHAHHRWLRGLSSASCRERRARSVGRLTRAQLLGAPRELQVSEERLELECGRGVRAGTGLARGGGRLRRAQLLRRGRRLESTPAEERGELRGGEAVHLVVGLGVRFRGWGWGEGEGEG